MRIATRNCTTASCLIFATMTGVVKVTPTGTVEVLLAGVPVAATGGGACGAQPSLPLATAKATATCDAQGLPQGMHKISVSYSGDPNFDPSQTTRSIRVKGAPSAQPH